MNEDQKLATIVTCAFSREDLTLAREAGAVPAIKTPVVITETKAPPLVLKQANAATFR